MATTTSTTKIDSIMKNVFSSLTILVEELKKMPIEKLHIALHTQ